MSRYHQVSWTGTWVDSNASPALKATDLTDCPRNSINIYTHLIWEEEEKLTYKTFSCSKTGGGPRRAQQTICII